MELTYEGQNERKAVDNSWTIHTMSDVPAIKAHREVRESLKVVTVGKWIVALITVIVVSGMV